MNIALKNASKFQRVLRGKIIVVNGAHYFAPSILFEIDLLTRYKTRGDFYSFWCIKKQPISNSPYVELQGKIFDSPFLTDLHSFPLVYVGLWLYLYVCVYVCLSLVSRSEKLLQARKKKYFEAPLICSP